MRKEASGFSVIPQLKKIDLSLEECLKLYKNQYVSDDFYIYGERIYNEKSEATYTTPSVYHLFYFNSNKNLRGLHLTIETLPWVKGSSSKAISFNLNNTYGKSLVNEIINQEPEKIASSILEIEKQVVKSNEYESPLFSGRKDSNFYFYGLMFKLDELLNK